MKILWKEWRQQRMFFFLGCFLGILFPLFEVLDGLRCGKEIRTDMGTGIVLGLGSLFALILAVATTYDDVRKGTFEFWQSKPVSPAKLLTVKFLVGAVILYVAFLITQSLDFISCFKTRRYNLEFIWQAFSLTWPIAVMIFSVAMFLTILIRDAAKAVLMAIWAALLVYFLPLLIGQLRWFNIFEQLRGDHRGKSVVLFLMDIVIGYINYFFVSLPPHVTNRIRVPVVEMTLFQSLWSIISTPEYLHYLVFLGVNLGISLACVVLSVKAVKRRWCWDPGQKTIAWTLGLSGMFIFGLSMFQIGHNLQPLTTYQGKPFDPTFKFYDTPEKTIDWLDPIQAGPMFSAPQQWSYYNYNSTRQFTTDSLMGLVSIISEKGIKWQSPVPARDDWWIDLYQFPVSGKPTRHLSKIRFFSTNSPSFPSWSHHIAACFEKGNNLFIAYQPRFKSEKKNPSRDDPGYCTIRFFVADIRNPKAPKLISDQELYRPEKFGLQREAGCSNYDDYCYIGLADELLVISIANPNKPRIVKKIPSSDFQLKEDSIPNMRFNIEGKNLICSAYDRILILDLKDPESPRKIFFQKFEKEFTDRNGISAVVFSNGFLYLAHESGITVYQLKEGPDGRLVAEHVGSRPATPLERMAGRQSIQLLIDRNRLFEAAGSFGVLVYDISNPAAPKRIFHGGEEMQCVNSLGTWNGLFYIANSSYSRTARLTFLKIPAGK